jgi:outer membrane protein
LQQDFETKVKTSQAQLSTKEKSYRKEVGDFQYKIDRGLMTRSDAEERQKELLAKEQELLRLQNDLRTQLAEEEQVAYRNVLNSIMMYLEEYKMEHNYDFVLGTTFGGNILYADNRLNITNQVVQGLNAQYKKDKEKTSK